MTQTVDDKGVRHLLWLRDQLGDGLLDAIVITTGRDAYRRRDGVAVVPAALLGPESGRGTHRADPRSRGD
jgi:hypothetical protein